MTTLYERWRQIAALRGREPALCDLASGKRWSFAELARAAEAAPRSPPGMVCPQGTSAGFVLAVLGAWRDESIVCPLETEQSPPAVPPPPAGCVHLKTTSASSGQPRLVAFTAEQLAADAETIVVTMGLRPEWPNLGAISLAHSYGFSNLVLPLLLHGIPLILAPSPLPEAVRRAAASEPEITLPAVPALWRTWHEAGAIAPSIRLAISAGAPLPADLEREIHSARGLKIHNFYGSSECGGIAYDASLQPREEGTFAGTPMSQVKVSCNRQGCLRVRSGAVGETYWPEPSDSLGKGVFQTSDLAELRAGAVHLLGRLGDQINVAGRKVQPEQIERALAAHEAVGECLVFGVPALGSSRSETIVACVAARSRVSGDQLRQFLLGRLPAWQIPREWHFVKSLAANTRGKLSRADWRRKYINQAAADGTQSNG